MSHSNPNGCKQSLGAIRLGDSSLELPVECACRKLIAKGLCTPGISRDIVPGHPVPIKKERCFPTPGANKKRERCLLTSTRDVSLVMSISESQIYHCKSDHFESMVSFLLVRKKRSRLSVLISFGFCIKNSAVYSIY